MATYESRRYNTPVPDAAKIADGSVNNTEFEHLDGVTSDIQTQINTKLNTTGGTITGNVTITDNDHLYIGDGQDIDILSDGTTGFIKGNDLRLQSSTGENYITTAINGATKLFYDNVQKAETTGSGLTVSGAMAATTLTGNGSALTALNGSNIASGTVADARISTLTSSKLTGALPAIDGSALTGIAIVASATTDIGSIMPFMLKRSGNSSQGNLTISAGTEVTPSTYTSGIFVISDYDDSLSKVPRNSPSYELGSTKGFMGIGQQTAGSSTSKTGVWRVIDPLFAGSASGGQGANSYTYYYSVMGLMQRIS
jgi:hypothetical protein